MTLAGLRRRTATFARRLRTRWTQLRTNVSRSRSATKMPRPPHTPGRDALPPPRTWHRRNLSMPVPRARLPPARPHPASVITKALCYATTHSTASTPWSSGCGLKIRRGRSTAGATSPLRECGEVSRLVAPAVRQGRLRAGPKSEFRPTLRLLSTRDGMIQTSAVVNRRTTACVVADTQVGV
jgi:hypothetical protein